MITYKAAYQIDDDGVDAVVLDFPGVFSCGEDLEEARVMLADALIAVAKTNILLGEPLAVPNPSVEDPSFDIVEPIHLFLNAYSQRQSELVSAANEAR
jgi:predicted RNase H-like HicB family nuclease